MVASQLVEKARTVIHTADSVIMQPVQPRRQFGDALAHPATAWELRSSELAEQMRTCSSHELPCLMDHQRQLDNLIRQFGTKRIKRRHAARLQICSELQHMENMVARGIKLEPDRLELLYKEFFQRFGCPNSMPAYSALADGLDVRDVMIEPHTAIHELTKLSSKYCIEPTHISILRSSFASLRTVAA